MNKKKFILLALLLLCALFLRNVRRYARYRPFHATAC